MSNQTNMYDDFSKVVIGENEISSDAVLEILKEYSGTISIFDLMAANAEMIEENKYVPGDYKEQVQGVYAKYFLGRIKEIRDDTNHYENNIDNEEFIEAVATLKIYDEEESISSKSKFPLIYGIVSIYTTFILNEPIHPVGTPFPGSLKVEEKDGVYYCPVKEANLDSPNAVCKMCIAEQLEH